MLFILKDIYSFKIHLKNNPKFYHLKPVFQTGKASFKNSRQVLRLSDLQYFCPQPNNQSACLEWLFQFTGKYDKLLQLTFKLSVISSKY